MVGHVAAFNELSSMGSMLTITQAPDGYEVFDRKRNVSVICSFETALELLTCHLSENGIEWDKVQVIKTTLEVVYNLNTLG